LIAKSLSYLLLLAVLAGVVVEFPMLWEPALAAAIGGAYWIFFRAPTGKD